MGYWGALWDIGAPHRGAEDLGVSYGVLGCPIGCWGALWGVGVPYGVTHGVLGWDSGAPHRGAEDLGVPYGISGCPTGILLGPIGFWVLTYGALG